MTIHSKKQKNLLMAIHFKIMLAILHVAILVSLVTCPSAVSQSREHRLGKNLQFHTIDSKALAGNRIGDPSRREMAVLLPPSYFAQTARRYPVVYLLHGLGYRKDGHLSQLYILTDMYDRMRRRILSEMILVAVDGSTVFGGSYYANSPTIGNFEEYMVRDVVGYVDRHFRTLGVREGRGVAGFSMGGHGAVKLGMKYADVFALVGSLSGSPLSVRYRKTIYRNALLNHARPSNLKTLLEEVTFERNWNLAAAYAKAAAFSPNALNPPFYLDLPFAGSTAEEDDPVWQLWWDDDPLALVARHSRGLRTLTQIYIDQGDDETMLGTEDFDRELVRYGVGHLHYIYRGDHTDKMAPRYYRMLKEFAVQWAIGGQVQ